MRPVLDDAHYRAVIEAAENGCNPFHFTDPAVRTDQVINAVNEGLDGLADGEARRIAASLAILNEQAPRLIGNPTGLADIDLVTAQLLQHLDIDPLMVAWLSRVCQGVRLHDDDTLEEIAMIDGHLAPLDDQCDTCVTLDPDIVWKSSGTVFVAGLPTSLASASIGKPLSSIVSHPALDTHGFTVTDVLDTGSAMAMTVDVRHRLLTPDDLLAMSPGGTR